MLPVEGQLVLNAGVARAPFHKKLQTTLHRQANNRCRSACRTGAVVHRCSPRVGRFGYLCEGSEAQDPAKYGEQDGVHEEVQDVK